MVPNAFMLTDDEHIYAQGAYAALIKAGPSLDPEAADDIAHTYGVVTHQAEPVPYTDAERTALARLEKMRPGECEAIAQSTGHDTPEALADAETTLGHPIPDELRELLLETDGVEGEYGLGVVWSLERIVADHLRWRTEPRINSAYAPFDQLLFFADAGNGDQFALSRDGGNVVWVWDHESDDRRPIAPRVRDYLTGWLGGSLAV